jgi:TolA-binding protein
LSNKKNNKGRIWLYAVILFTSAFVVLLITAYSQIKFNKNIDNYRSQIHSNESEKNKFRLNLDAAINKNIILENEIKILDKEISEAEEKIKKKEEENIELTENHQKTIDSYEALIIAGREYQKGNAVECAEMLYKQVDIDCLNKEGMAEYNYLAEKTFKRASHVYYLEGYKYFNNKDYVKAMDSFFKSLEMSDNEYFSDDCYYYLAYSAYKAGDEESARAYIKTLKEKYPDSQYLDDAETLLRLLG